MVKVRKLLFEDGVVRVSDLCRSGLLSLTRSRFAVEGPSTAPTKSREFTMMMALADELNDDEYESLYSYPPPYRDVYYDPVNYRGEDIQDRPYFWIATAILATFILVVLAFHGTRAKESIVVLAKRDCESSLI
jgi:hypothetical protein